MKPFFGGVGRFSRGVLLLLLVPGSLYGDTFFVAPDGHDQHDGRTPQSAFATVQRGVNALQSGDTLTIAPGEYVGAVRVENLGAAHVDTVIRAMIPGTVLIRGDVPLSGWNKVEGYRYVYVTDYANVVQAVNELDTVTVIRASPNVQELDSVPGLFYQDFDAGKLYLSPSDMLSPVDRHYTAVISSTSGLYLRNLQRVHVEGIGVTGFNNREPYPAALNRQLLTDYATWGIALVNSRDCVIRDCQAYLNGRGIGTFSREANTGDNIIERCVAWGNMGEAGDNSGGLRLGAPRREIIRDSISFLNGHKGVNIRGSADVPADAALSRLERNLAWGNAKIDIRIKPNASNHVAERNVTENSVEGFRSEYNTIRYGRGSGRHELNEGGSILMSLESPSVNRHQEFADPDNWDYRLQETSRFRGTGPNGTDRGAHAYQPDIFYVSPSGDDTKDGLSVDAAWRTLSWAVMELSPGDTLYILEGVYAESLHLSGLAGGVGNPVRIRRRGSGEVVIQGAVSVDQCSGVEFERLNFAGGVTVLDGSQIKFHNCRFMGVASAALTVEAIDTLRVTHCEFSGFTGTALELQNSSGIFLAGNIFDNVQGFGVRTDLLNAMHYSDYNSYTTASRVWEAAGQTVTLQNLQVTHGNERYGRQAAPDYLDVSLQNPLDFAAIGPMNAPLGVYIPHVYYLPALRVDNLRVHSATPRTATIEWWATQSNRSQAFVVRWGLTPEVQDGSRVMDKSSITYANIFQHRIPKRWAFNTFSIIDLQPNTQYYVRVEANGVAQGTVSFMTPADPLQPRLLYVAPDGDDAASGLDRNQAWRTVNHAADQVRPGDTVFLAGGIYRETVRLRVTGEQAAPITFTSMPGEKVVFDGNNRMLWTAFNIFDKHYINIDGFYFQNFRQDESGYFTLARSGHIQITRCFGDGRSSGVNPYFVSGYKVNDLLIRNCVHNSGWGFLSINDISNLRVEHSVVIRVDITTWGLAGAVSGVSVSDCVITDNLAIKSIQPLARTGHAPVNNVFFLRVPEAERAGKVFGADGPTVDAYNQSSGANPPNAVANPRFAGLAHLPPTEFFTDGMRSSLNEFQDVFVMDPLFRDRGVGLVPAEFAGVWVGPVRAPSALTAEAVSSSQIDLVWTNNASNADGFEIERRVGGGAWQPLAVTDGDATTWSDTGLTPQTLYSYRVRAFNTEGQSAFASEASATTPASELPDPPAALTAVPVTAHRIDLSWTDAAMKAEGFTIERRIGSSYWEQIGTTAAPATTYTDTNLSPETPYTYRVRAQNRHGHSAYSEDVEASTPAATLPSAPVALSATLIFSSRARLSWTDTSLDADGFEIERKFGDANWTPAAVVGRDVTEWQDDHLPPGTLCAYRLRAFNAAGVSPYSNEATVTTPAGGGTFYVWGSGPQTPQALFASWETAARTIQDAVDEATAGSVILVAPGGYTATGSGGSVVHIGADKLVAGMSFVLRGALPPGVETGRPVIDGGGVHRGIGLSPDFAATARMLTIEGFDILNGDTAGGGGGISTLDADIRNLELNVIDCVIAGNLADGSGGGIFAYRADSSGFSLNLVRCVVSNNVAQTGHGGGIYGSRVRVIDSRLEQNAANQADGQQGGGIYARSSLWVENSRLTGNQVSTSGHASNDGGSALHAHYGTVFLRNVLVADNHGIGGKAIQLSRGSALRLESCTLVNHTGGTLDLIFFLHHAVTFEMYNSIIAGGNTHLLTGASALGSPESGSTIRFVHNRLPTDLVGTVTPAGEPVEGGSTVTDDPNFVNSAGDYRLSPGSPCIDSGLNQPWMLGAVDLRGNPRILGATVDLGCFEAGVEWAGIPAQLAFGVQPTDTLAGDWIAPAVTVEVRDALGTRVPDGTETVTLALEPHAAGGTLSGTLTRTAVNGVATFPDLRINFSGGGYRLLAHSGELREDQSDPFDILDGAGLTVPYAQDFESVSPGKMQSAEFDGWRIGADDASVIAEKTTIYTGTFPLPDSEHRQVLVVDTAAQPLTAAFAMPNDAPANLYLDQLMCFVRRSVPPDFEQDTETKFACYVNDEGAFVLFHGGADGDTATISTFPVLIEPGAWHRLTIPMHMHAVVDPGDGQGSPFFQVMLDGAVLSHPTAGFGAPSLTPSDAAGGGWFRFANRSSQRALGRDRRVRSVDFMGFGWVDDFVLTDLAPVFDGVRHVRTVLGANGFMSPAGVSVAMPFPAFEIAVPSGGPVAITYQAQTNYPFFMIERLSADGIEIPEASGRLRYAWVRDSVYADISNRVSFVPQRWEGDGQSPRWWAQDRGYAAGGALSIHQGYLLNQEDLDAPFVLIDIGRIPLDGTDYPFVKWTSSGPTRGWVQGLSATSLTDPESWRPVPGTYSHDRGTNTWIGTEAAASTAFYILRVHGEP